MVKTSHNKTIRISIMEDYIINSSNEFIIIDTADRVVLQLPHMLKDNDRINVISVVAAPDIRIHDENGVTIKTLTTDYGYLQLEYNSSADAYVFRELVAPTVTPVDSGWIGTLDNASLVSGAITVPIEFAANGDSQSYLSVVDCTIADVNGDLTPTETQGNNYIKNIKVTGDYNLILASTAGFSDGTNSLVIADSAIIFWDGFIWQILYNSEWKTKVVDISSAEILAMGTTPIELLPAPGVGNYYDIDRVILKYTFGTLGYTVGEDLAIGDGSNNLKTIAEFLITDAASQISILSDISYPSLENAPRTLKTAFGADPTDGDGTLQVIIKYRVLTF